MSRLRAVLWSVAAGVTAVVVAALLFRMIPGHGAVFLALLVLCCAFFSALLGALVQASARIGAGAGAFAAALVALVLGMTIAAAPLQPGARRPGFSDLLWLPLGAFLAGVALCATAGWLGANIGQRFANRRHAAVRPPP